MNAHCERVIGGIRREALDHVLIIGEAHARQVLAGYQDHCDSHRPHRARQRLPPDADRRPATVPGLDDRRLLRTRVLGGVINEHRYAARRAAMTFRALQGQPARRVRRRTGGRRDPLLVLGQRDGAHGAGAGGLPEQRVAGAVLPTG
ncbi:integrase core domain-containing protein [Streptomyces hirsutus]|uniref:integrase core domain-containing protein n=1 Tax=Streptomyces hirsutus TaxID=35620 RepID=UPI003424B1AC